MNLDDFELTGITNYFNCIIFIINYFFSKEIITKQSFVITVRTDFAITDDKVIRFTDDHGAELNSIAFPIDTSQKDVCYPRRQRTRRISSALERHLYQFWSAEITQLM